MSSSFSKHCDAARQFEKSKNSNVPAKKIVKEVREFGFLILWTRTGSWLLISGGPVVLLALINIQRIDGIKIIGTKIAATCRVFLLLSVYGHQETCVEVDQKLKEEIQMSEAT